MRQVFKIVMVAVVLAGTVPVPQASAAGPNGLRPQAQNPQRLQSCKPKWPYIQLTCVA